MFNPNTQSLRPTAMAPSRASANVLPTTGWPAIGISVPGVKMRMRTSVSGRSAWRDERRFCKADLAGDLLHGLRRKARRLRKDRELVAAEPAVGEDVVVRGTGSGKCPC